MNQRWATRWATRWASALGALALGLPPVLIHADEPPEGVRGQDAQGELVGPPDPAVPPDTFLTPVSNGRWSGGVGLLLAKPYFENNPAYWLGRYDLHQQVGVLVPVPPPPVPPPPVPPLEPPPPAPPVTKQHFLASEFVLTTNAQGQPVLKSKRVAKQDDLLKDQTHETHPHKSADDHDHGRKLAKGQGKDHPGNGPPCGLPPGPPPGGPPHGGPPWDLPKGPPPKNCDPVPGGGNGGGPGGNTNPPPSPPSPPSPPNSGGGGSTTNPPTTTPPQQQPPSQPPTQPPQQPPPPVTRWRAVHSIRRKDFDPGLEVAPRVWLEWRGDEGVGVRARFWRFEQHLDEFVFNPAPGANGEAGEVEVFSADPLGLHIDSPGPLLSGQLNVGGNVANFNGSGADFLLIQSSLELWAIDLEATEEGQLGRWRFLASAGLRYAHLAQSYDAYRFNRDNVPGVANVEADAAVLLSGHHFKGIGPTVALEAKRPLGNSAFALYGLARGSLLFGQSKQEAHFAAVVAGTATGGGLPAGPFKETTFIDASATHDDVLPVAELEAGIEWSRPIRDSRLFIQAGVMAQNWFGAGGASSEDGNLGFLGLTLSVGLQF